MIMSQITLVGVSFHAAGKIFDFDARDFKLLPGDQVIVETERGRSLGTIVTSPRPVSAKQAPPKLKPIMRLATESDLQMATSNRSVVMRRCAIAGSGSRNGAWR